MKITIRELRLIIRRALVEAGGASPFPQHIRNALSPSEVPGESHLEDEELKQMKFDDTADDPDELPPHLRDVTVELEDTEGPVPPTAEDPYVQQDPFVRGSSPLPTPGIRR